MRNPNPPKDFSNDPGLMAMNNTQPARADALPELLPCPFCGGEAMLREESPFNVCCLNCEADSLWSRDFTECVAAWNRRPASAPDAELIALRTALNNCVKVLDNIYDEGERGFKRGVTELPYCHYLPMEHTLKTARAILAKHSTAAEEGHG